MGVILVRRFIGPACLLLLLLTWAAPGAGEDVPLTALIYDDTQSTGPSTWALGVDAIDRTLQANGMRTRRLTRTELNATGVPAAAVLVFGGGYAYPGYTHGITPAGKAAIRRAVRSGTAFVGICAGAWIACRTVVYDGVSYGRETGYDLALLDAAGYGPVPTLARFPSSAPALVRVAASAATGAGSVRRIQYGGGPYFQKLPANTSVLATYEVPGSEAHARPAVIALKYGRGTVVLWGPHPEMTGPGVDTDNPVLFATVVRWAARGGAPASPQP